MTHIIDWATLPQGTGFIRIGTLQICYGSYSATSAGNAETFAAPFASTPVAVSEVLATDAATYASFIRGVNTTTITIKTNVATARTVFYIAIGQAA